MAIIYNKIILHYSTVKFNRIADKIRKQRFALFIFDDSFFGRRVQNNFFWRNIHRNNSIVFYLSIVNVIITIKRHRKRHRIDSHAIQIKGRISNAPIS